MPKSASRFVHVISVAFPRVLKVAKRLPVLLAVATVAGAQAAPPTPKPAYLTQRFDEQWTAAHRTSHWDDAIKAMPLIPGQPVTLTVGGQARWREEFMRQYNLSPSNDDYGQSRLQLSADLFIGQRTKTFARLFTEVRDAQSYGRTLPGGTRTSDADRHDVQNLFADIGHGSSWVRYGRQEIALNRERLIGVPDWANTRREADGTRVHLARGAFVVEAIDARPVLVRQTLPNRADSTSRYRTVSLGGTNSAPSRRAMVPAQWQAYWYEQTIHTVVANTQRLTTGARTQWQTVSPRAAQRYGLELEGAAQRGNSGPVDINAWFWIAESSVQWRRARGAPSLAIGIEEASGNRTATTGRNEMFSVLYPAAHSHGGIADVIGRANVRELHAIGSWSPQKSWDLRAALYRFDRLHTDDGVYTKGNAVFRSANGSTELHVADEMDFTATWKATRHLRVIAGGAVVLPGPFLKTTTSGAATEKWSYVGTTFTF